MKKPLLLIFALFSCLAGWTQITSLDELSTDKAYTIYNPYFTTYAVYSAENTSVLVWAAGTTSSGTIANNEYKTPLDPTDPSSSWMIVQFKGEWFVYNIGAKRFLEVGYNPENASTAPATLPYSPKPVEIISNGNGGFYLRSHQGEKNYMCAAPQLTYPISTWTSSDNGSTWEIKENPQVQADYATCLELLNLAFPETSYLEIDTRHGYVWSTKNGGAMPNKIPKGQDFTFYTRSHHGWSCPDGLTIKHGTGEYKVTDIASGAYATEITIPADKVEGDVITISGEWVRDENNPDARVLSFADEFNGDGEPSEQWWKRTVREGATWNRWCSNSPDVVYQFDGYLFCRAIPNPDKTTDNVPMITGGIKTQDKFSFQWGRAEARIKTYPYTGTFPAFWMMPADNSLGWPNNGEIDIWETIDDGTVAYGTVHTNWTYNLNKGGNGGQKGGMDYTLWHIYAVEWSESAITWYVDGEKVWTYSKSTDQSALDQGQWPFNAPFYLILNQSVGNGSWARPADESHTYETLFDWVRVYQKPEHTGIQDLLSTEEKSEHNSDAYYDMSGRKLSTAPSQGVYIRNGKIYIK